MRKEKVNGEWSGDDGGDHVLSLEKFHYEEISMKFHYEEISSSKTAFLTRVLQGG